jgi:hypothetical protein
MKITIMLLQARFKRASTAILVLSSVDWFFSKERSAFQFLLTNNYSIPPNARYLGVLRGPSPNPVEADYIIAFQHIAGHVPVSDSPLPIGMLFGEGISIIVDQYSGKVEHFHYEWFEIGLVQAEGIITRWKAMEIAKSHSYSNSSPVACNLSIVKSIRLSSISMKNPDERGFSLYLAWTTVLKKVARHDVLVDAQTGRFIGEILYRNGLELEPIKELDLKMIFAIPIISLIPAAIVFVLSKRRPMTSTPDHDRANRFRKNSGKSV